jgi:hypothetical protein
MDVNHGQIREFVLAISSTIFWNPFNPWDLPFATAGRRSGATTDVNKQFHSAVNPRARETKGTRKRLKTSKHGREVGRSIYKLSDFFLVHGRAAILNYGSAPWEDASWHWNKLERICLGLWSSRRNRAMTTAPHIPHFDFTAEEGATQQIDSDTIRNIWHRTELTLEFLNP